MDVHAYIVSNRVVAHLINKIHKHQLLSSILMMNTTPLVVTKLKYDNLSCQYGYKLQYIIFFATIKLMFKAQS